MVKMNKITNQFHVGSLFNYNSWKVLNKKKIFILLNMKII